jgi:hypothetical protein
MIVTTQQKVRARKALNHAVAAGKIIPQPCEKCSAPKAQGHHDDYSKPLEVRWWCARCHSQHHNQKHPTTKACEVCGAIFTPHPTKRARAKTCSPACRAKSISKSLMVTPVIPPWAKLDKAAAERIRGRYAAGGVTQRALAREFNIHHSQIGCIVRGEAWK